MSVCKCGGVSADKTSTMKNIGSIEWSQCVSCGRVFDKWFGKDEKGALLIKSNSPIDFEDLKEALVKRVEEL